MKKTTTPPVQLPQTTWRRHFEPLLFLIHCANAIWIVRVFMVNYQDMRGNYFIDIYFLSGFVCVLVLHQVRWRIIFSSLIDKKYESSIELRQDMEKMTQHLMKAVPYFMKITPSDEILQKGAEKILINNNGIYHARNLFNLFNEFVRIKRFLYLNLLFIFLFSCGLMFKLKPSRIGNFIFDNWFSSGVLDVFCAGILIYSILIVINFIFKGE
jgi:hypothetical protein